MDPQRGKNTPTLAPGSSRPRQAGSTSKNTSSRRRTITKAVFERDWREIQQQRAILASAAPAPLFTQQQSVLTTLVDAWDLMTADARKQTLGAIFDNITASAEGVDRLEPCESWRAYVVAAIPQQVEVRRGPTERKTGLEPADRTRSHAAAPRRRARPFAPRCVKGV